jgi:hypothetical protein
MHEHRELQIEQLEPRLNNAANFETVSFLGLSDLRVAVATDEAPLTFIGRDVAAGTPTVGHIDRALLDPSLPLSVQLTQNSLFHTPTVANGNLEELTAISGGYREGTIKIAGIIDQKAAVITYNGVAELTVVTLRTTLGERISDIETGASDTYLVETPDDRQILNVDGIDYAVPEGFIARNIAPTRAGDSSVMIAGRTALGAAASIQFNLSDKAFTAPEILTPLPASVDHIFSRLDGDNNLRFGMMLGDTGSEKFIAITPLEGSDRTQQMLSQVDDANIVVADGAFAYKNGGEWMLFLEHTIGSRSLGLEQNTPIPIRGLVEQLGYQDVTVNSVTDIITQGAGDLMVVLDIEIAGFGPFSAIVSGVDPIPLHNAELPVDALVDGGVHPLDVLVIINDLNRDGSRRLGVRDVQRENYLVGESVSFLIDVNGDGFISPLDALIVINYLNSRNRGGGEGEGTNQSFASTADQQFGVPADYIYNLISDDDLVDSISRRRRGR